MGGGVLAGAEGQAGVDLDRHSRAGSGHGVGAVDHEPARR